MTYSRENSYTTDCLLPKEGTDAWDNCMYYDIPENIQSCTIPTTTQFDVPQHVIGPLNGRMCFLKDGDTDMIRPDNTYQRLSPYIIGDVVYWTQFYSAGASFSGSGENIRHGPAVRHGELVLLTYKNGGGPAKDAKKLGQATAKICQAVIKNSNHDIYGIHSDDTGTLSFIDPETGDTIVENFEKGNRDFQYEVIIGATPHETH